MTRDLWTDERCLWTDGPDAYTALMREGAVMVFPDPAGVMTGRAILEAVAAAPRWSDVAFEETRLVRWGETVHLSYRATARRDDGPAYHALCGSVWTETVDGLRLAAHQQTPTE